MTEQDQLKALAELDGWTSLEITDDGLAGLRNGKRTGPLGCGLAFVPDYLHSYDAIIPLIQKQSWAIQQIVWFEICMLLKSQHVWNASESQLCEHLLRAIGKWKD